MPDPMWTAAFALLRGYALPIGLGLLAVVIIGAAFVRGDRHGRAALQPKVDALARDLAAVAKTQRAVEVERDRLAARLAFDTSTAKESLHAENVAADRRLAAAVAAERLRRPTPAGVPLRPADSAPAPCREYEAPPALLPLRDRELLLALGAAADRVVRERNACVAHVERIRRAFDEWNERARAAALDATTVDALF